MGRADIYKHSSVSYKSSKQNQEVKSKNKDRGQRQISDVPEPAELQNQKSRIWLTELMSGFQAEAG